MAEIPDDLKDGDALEPYHFNAAYRELRRWQKLKGVLPVVVEGAEGDDGPSVWLMESRPFFIQLTGGFAGTGYPWVEVLIGPGRAVTVTTVAGDPATNSGAV